MFGSREYLKKVAADCWTHELVKLVELGGLKDAFEAACKANTSLASYWAVARLWSETGRYAEKTETDAKVLFEAVSHKSDGVLKWIQSHW